MQLTISGHHLDVTEAIHDYVTNKIGRLERHNDHITNVAVILSVDKLVQKAEATVHGNGVELFADSEHEDLYAAVDALVDKLDRQLIKRKEKLRGH
ncbi:MAG TPA: ribosome-associated translation inhibitor RaiA [Porticoccaceae bacterium]|nr:ribosome-associated translation inhibitor RaiA [Porticoccaceae bacterium]HCO59046.1 ribosome-associated translation inhibitor RaiA [Porticoccaceae bacterium]